MKKFLFFTTALFFLFGTAGLAGATIIDFTGGTATLTDGTTVITDDDTCYFNVDYYVEDGILIDFVNGAGIIGNYYQWYTGVGTNNSVIHAHPFSTIDIVFSSVDGSAFDLNYVDMTSNTIVGGGASDGTESSYISNDSGYDMLLPSSDWGIEVLSDGSTASDGIARLWLDSNFDDITSFTLWSNNAYCFGMDNFYINEEPPSIPEPSTMLLLGAGLVGIVGARKKIKK